jgi:hypothetical protein
MKKRLLTVFLPLIVVTATGGALLQIAFDRDVASRSGSALTRRDAESGSIPGALARRNGVDLDSHVMREVVDRKKAMFHWLFSLSGF